jgi:hypothetical protein
MNAVPGMFGPPIFHWYQQECDMEPSLSGPDAEPSGPQRNGSELDPIIANGGVVSETLDAHDLLLALQAMRVGDFSVRLPRDHTGLSGKIADTFNEIVSANERMAQQLEHVGQVVGREGRTRQRVDFGLSGGA